MPTAPGTSPDQSPTDSSSTELSPAAFLGHGSPMNALEVNRYTEAWQTFGLAAGRPRAILCISAHWYINATALTAMARPPTIHDFYGFPDELFAVEYPAPGDPELAAEIAEVVKPHWVGMDRDSWGIDHGAWSVLMHAFPEADIPVLQLSVNAQHSFDQHVQLGAALAPLRRRGVVIVGSGNVVHNLRMIDWNRPEGGYDWACRFDEAAHQVIADDPDRAASLAHHRDFAMAHPSPDHFIPLLYLAGLAAADDTPANTLVDGCAMGSLSMASYGLGTTPDPKAAPVDGATGRGAGPSLAPPEQTNL